MSHSHEEMTEEELEQYHEKHMHNAWRGDAWELPVLFLLVVIDVCGLFLGWRGVGFVIILTVAVAILMFVRSTIVAILVIVLAPILMFLYLLVAYQSL